MIQKIELEKVFDGITSSVKALKELIDKSDSYSCKSMDDLFRTIRDLQDRVSVLEKKVG